MVEEKNIVEIGQPPTRKKLDKLVLLEHVLKQKSLKRSPPPKKCRVGGSGSTEFDYWMLKISQVMDPGDHSVDSHALSAFFAPVAPSKGWYTQASEASKHEVTYIWWMHLHTTLTLWGLCAFYDVILCLGKQMWM